MCSYIWHVWAASTRLNACKWCTAFVCVCVRIQTSTHIFRSSQYWVKFNCTMLVVDECVVVFKFCIYFTRYAIFNAFNVCLCVYWSALGHGACGFASKCYTRYIYIYCELAIHYLRFFPRCDRFLPFLSPFLFARIYIWVRGTALV